MDVDECIEAYIKLIKAIFAKQSSRLPVNWMGNMKARFDSSKLKAAVEEVIASKGASPTDRFNDGKAQRCRT